MEWGVVVAIPIILMAALCPLMMIGMMAMPWIMRRRGHAGAGHSGHGMMMCHGMGHDSDGQQEAPSASLVEELKAERERLDRLIEKAEGQEVGGRK